MKPSAAALLLLLLLLAAACNPSPVAACGFDGDCRQGSSCVAGKCVVGDAAPGDLQFLVLPPTGSALAPEVVPDPCRREAAGPSSCLRQLPICPWPRLSLSSVKGQRVLGRGTLLPGLDLVQDLDVELAGIDGDPQLLPGDWSLLFVPGAPSPPVSYQVRVGTCEDSITVNFQEKNATRELSVAVVADKVYEPGRPFCDVTLDVVTDPVSQRLISNQQALPATRTMGDPSVCLSDDPTTFTALLQMDGTADNPWLRIRPRDGGRPTAPTQFVEIPSDATSLTVSARAALQSVRIQVLDDVQKPVVGASIRLQGTLEKNHLDCQDPSKTCVLPRFATSEVRPDPVPGFYQAFVPAGCYSIEVTPPPGTLQSIGTVGEVMGGAPAPCDNPSQLHVRQGKVVNALVTLSPRNALNVTVRSADGDRVFGAVVTALPLGKGRVVKATTGQNGIAELQLDAEQDYNLEIAPTSGDTPRTRVSASLASSLTVDLPRAARVVGQVVLGSGGPVSQAVVQAFHAPIAAGARPVGEGVTDADGRFSILVPVAAASP